MSNLSDDDLRSFLVDLCTVYEKGISQRLKQETNRITDKPTKTNKKVYKQGQQRVMSKCISMQGSVQLTLLKRY